ncbi:MAG: ABC transporter permease [Thaumarchaeota archaeon]|nr:ABC transporter permease [Nitrososphaerota archaeon]
MVSSSRTAEVIERDFRIFFADRYMLVIMFVNFMIDLGVSGLSLGAMIRNLGFSYFLYIAPGANLITATVAAFQSGRDVWRERVIQDTQQYLLTLPIRKNVFAVSRLFSGMLRTMVTVLPGTIVIGFLYGLNFQFFLVGLMIMFVYSGAVAGLSVAAASLANSLELFATVRSTAQVYLSFFSTQFYPSSILPPAVAAVSAFNPMTWAVQSFRALQAGSVDLALFVPLTALSAALMAAGFLLYRRTMNY